MKRCTLSPSIFTPRKTQSWEPACSIESKYPLVSFQACLACAVKHKDGVLSPQARQIPQEDVALGLEQVDARQPCPAVENGFGRRGPFVRHQEISPIGWPLIDGAGNLLAKFPPAVELPRLICSRGEGQKGLQQMQLDHETHQEADDKTGGEETPVGRPGRINVMKHGTCEDEPGDVGRGGPVRLGHLAHGRGEAEEERERATTGRGGRGRPDAPSRD